MSRAKQAQASTFNRRNILVSFLAITLIVALILLPEIVGLHGSILAPKQATKSVEVTSSGSPLDRIAQMLDIKDSKYSDSKSSLSLDNSSSDQNKKIDLTWDVLSSKQYTQVFKSNQKKIYELVNRLEVENIGTRNSLMNFASAIQYVLSGPRSVLSAREAVMFLANALDQVNQALNDEDVTSEVIKNWKSINQDFTTLFAAVGTSSIRTGKAQVRTSVDLTQVRLRWGRSSNRLFVRGVISGSNIKSLEIYRNGIYMSKGKRQKEKNGKMPFLFASKDATGLYVIRVLSETGKVYDRRFKFLSANLPREVFYRGNNKGTLYLLNLQPSQTVENSLMDRF